MFEKNLRLAMLFDLYGELLTDTQKTMFDLYYNDDLSLAEISENTGITRQGVRDSIKRAEGTLLEMEERLGLARKFRVYRQKLEQIVDCANEIAFEAGRYPGSRKIEQDAKKILELAQQIED